MIRWLCLLLALAIGGLASPDAALNGQWDVWRAEHNKTYRSQEEEMYRRWIWEQTLREVWKHNQEASQGLHTFTVGVNHLADMTEKEVNIMLNGLKDEEYLHHENLTLTLPSDFSPLPSKVDWTQFGMVSPVQNQGPCGSCWAFSAVGGLEGQMKRATGRMVPLSPQNLVDCSGSLGNRGCHGGYISRSFTYIIKNNGIDSNSFYPYEHRDGRCRYSVKGRAGYCSSFRILPRRDEEALQYVVATVGPVSVGINAKLSSFHHYNGGVYNEKNCSPVQINHAVLIVGYGTENGQDYWLIKNSWGTSWGEKGYIRMARHRNLCGISNFAVVPMV